ncbi:dTTP/UTP pyrophosphatase [[Candida] anglica]|uniref:dTTP/UTP pyrophosphatase n=1 Tax=[Candida] anglica TaxID=148631 RepID=A0ABP0EDM4_9ASCO
MLNYSTYDKLKSYRFILASTSPRRKEILTDLGIANIEVIPSDFEENLPKTLAPADYVAGTAHGKIDAVYNQIKESPGSKIILASDTVVVNNGRIFEKPRNKEIQLATLQSFRENPIVSVMTAVVVYRLENGETSFLEESSVSETRLTFDTSISDEFLRAYVDSEEGLQAAGGFKVQGLGGLLWTELQGEYQAVVGLPFKGTFTLLEKVLQ